ncbi:hypothetical protein NA57DRAFT_79620 [Rhizodiscina lignyota]|uniref:Ankyrin n=1 Tax=Rhizodiscina lignyota TaxID=1504668 RepID=A0A9P4IA10_9PEZI|nr:hypothetical protein NA57DRAFT_79620 [Rhizodiscina lignyota]
MSSLEASAETGPARADPDESHANNRGASHAPHHDSNGSHALFPQEKQRSSSLPRLDTGTVQGNRRIHPRPANTTSSDETDGIRMVEHELYPPESTASNLPSPSIDIVVVHMFVGQPEHKDRDDLSSFVISEKRSAIKRLATAQVQGRPDSNSQSHASSPLRGDFENSRHTWLGDPNMLPKIVPEARILAFGYDLTTSNPTDTIDFDAQSKKLLHNIGIIKRCHCRSRPIIFLGYGYGGTWIQHKLIKDHYGDSDIVKATVGTLFFANPPRGAALLKKRTAAALPDTSRKLLDLGSDSKMVAKLHDDFKSLSRKYCFYYFNFVEHTPKENRPPELVTTSRFSSGTPGHNDTQGPLNYDYTMSRSFDQMLHFDGPSDFDFQAVYSRFLRLVHIQQLLSAAADPHGPQKLETLIHKGLDVNLQNRCGKSALHIAVERSNFNMVRSLLGRSAAFRYGRIEENVNITTRDGKSALDIAVEKGDKNIVDLLLRKRAKVSDRTRHLATKKDIKELPTKNAR